MIDFKPFKSTYLFLFLLLNFQLISCAQNKKEKTEKREEKAETIIKTAAERTNLYLNLLRGKNIAIVANQTSVLSVLQRAEVSPNVMGSKKVTHHLVDYLHNHKEITVKKVFAPEHGFRGKEDAAAHVADDIDTKTGLPILSLHGKSKKPSAKQLENIDVVVFDIQDVGVRFYTYISTLHFVMEACAENNVSLIVLDRPNPNAHYLDGPVLEPKHSSFVGKHPVPVVYGMTIGEYGQMINGEKWLKNGIQCDLKVIPLKNYTHNSKYSLPIKPSPNLPNDKSINLYPSLGFFEGTSINAGRGTEFQFQRYGAPFFEKTDFSYIPKANEGAKYPKHKNKLCYGVDLRKTKHLNKIDLSFLMDAYKKTPKTEKFFGATFTIHAGTEKLQEQLEQGLSEKEIKKSWVDGLEAFKLIRSKYLIYNNSKFKSAKTASEKFLKEQKIPGMSISVSKSGFTIWSEGFGYSDIKTMQKVVPNKTQFRIASISKTLTSLAIAKLVDDKKLNLDASLYKYVPDFPKKKYDFTIRQIGGHLAGIRHYNGNEFLLNKSMSIVKGLAIFKDSELLYKPGTKFKYSTYGWNLLSVVVQNASKEKYSNYMKNVIFNPLNMTNTVIEKSKNKLPNKTRFYVKRKGKILEGPTVDNEFKAAGGGFISTSEDLLSFGNQYIKPTIISKFSLQELVKQQKTSSGKNTNYGIGIVISKIKNNVLKYSHSGGGVGATTYLLIYPEKEIVISILTNLSGVKMKEYIKKLEAIFIDY